MTRAITFTQAQVRRAVKAAESAGLKVTGLRVFRDGFELEFGEMPTATYGQVERVLDEDAEVVL